MLVLGFFCKLGRSLRAACALRARSTRSRRSPCSRSRSARTRRCSACSTACSCGRCRTRTATGSSWSTTRIRRSIIAERRHGDPRLSRAAEQAPSLESLAIVVRAPRRCRARAAAARDHRTRVGFAVRRAAGRSGRSAVPSGRRGDVGQRSRRGLEPRALEHAVRRPTDLVDSDIRFDGDSFRVIGVMPHEFGFPDRDFDVYLPFAFTPSSGATRRAATSSRQRRPLASRRDRRGLDRELERSSSATSRRPLAGRRRDGRRLHGPSAAAARHAGRELAAVLVVLQAIVIVVLLIACANLANLQLDAGDVAAQGARRALGARRRRRAARAHGARRVAVARARRRCARAWVALGGLALVRALGLDRIGRRLRVRARRHGARVHARRGRARGRRLGLAARARVAARRPHGCRFARRAGRAGAAAGTAVTGALVVAQLAMSVTLLVGAGLLTKSFYGLLGPARVQRRQRLDGAVALGGPRYAERESWPRFEQQASKRCARCRVSPTPASPRCCRSPTTIFRARLRSTATCCPRARRRRMRNTARSTTGISPCSAPVVAGRNFAAHETERVVIVDENLANKYWPGVTRSANGCALTARPGLVHDRRRRAGREAWQSRGDPVKETVYWHYEQKPSSGVALALRTVVPPEQLARAVSARSPRSTPSSRCTTRSRWTSACRTRLARSARRWC